MKIANASVQMSAAHQFAQHSETHESLQMWIGQRPSAAGDGANRPPRPETQVRLSDQGRSLAQQDAVQGTDEISDDSTSLDPKLSLLRSMLESMLGRAIKVFSASELHAAQQMPEAPNGPSAPTPQTQTPPAGYGVVYDYHASFSESETTSFSASGTVLTSDGRELSFTVNLAMSRSYAEESNISLRLGDAARKVDPLVLNFNGSAAQLTDQRFSFDLNSDGKKESIATLSPNSGFLVFDRNGNGKIDNGSEMFGPASGNGFGELSALDDDHNGWIDENDAAFGKLQLWRPDASGAGGLESLGKNKVGAISLAHVATPFDLKNSDNQSLGQIRSSAMFLQEDGIAGTIQQIDLTA